MVLHGFTKASTNLDTNLKIILFDCQNNYVACSNWLLKFQNLLQYCSSCLKCLRNYIIDSPTKLFSDLYLAKFLNTSAKSILYKIIVYSLIKHFIIIVIIK